MSFLTRSPFGLAVLALLPGCDVASARAETSCWLCTQALMGLVIERRGDEVSAEAVLFDDAAAMPDPAKIHGPDDMGGLPLARGVYDTERKMVLFPLHTLSVVRANSAHLLRTNGAEHVECDADSPGRTLEVRWRTGSGPVQLTRTFVRCGN